MVGLCCRRKIIVVVVAHFMKITMDMRHPAAVSFEALFAFYLCLPHPIPVEVKKVVVIPAVGPGFLVLVFFGIWI